jgi:hypothetical protein
MEENISMASTVAFTLLIQKIQELGDEATAEKLKQLGWTKREIERAIKMGLIELTGDGKLRAIQEL